MGLKRLTVAESSNVAGLLYDSACQELLVRFKNNTGYLFRGVPDEVAGQAEQETSVGSYFNRVVRGRYESERMW